MVTAAPTLEAAGRGHSSWLEFWRTELAPTPGRLNATVRIVVASTIVLVTSMTLEVPDLGISLLIVLVLTQQSSVLTAITGILAIVALTLATALTILLLRATFDYPLFRLAAMALVLFAGMYLTQVSALGPVGFLIVIIVIVTQEHVDTGPGPEHMLRTVLWTWVAVGYPTALTIAVNLLLLPADPEPILRREAAVRLRVVARVLRARPTSEEARSAASALAAYATAGPGPLLKLMRFAEIRESALQALRAERTAKIVLLERLVESAALLPDLETEPSPDPRARLERIAAACESLAVSVDRDDRVAPLPPFPDLPDEVASSALTPVLAELERLVYELPVAERPLADLPVSGRRLFVPDAFTNPRYAHFALKVTMAAMFCYAAYTAVDWSGISTCMTTCAIVALGSAVASIHKATLRIVGCAIGGAAGLVAIVFLIPQMTSIVPLALLVAGVTAPAAWIAMGSKRTAYLGMQIAFAFYLPVLHGYAPSTDVTEFRDRIVGIVFGVIVMAVVFLYVWPARAGPSMVRSLAEALRRMAQIGIGRGAVAPGHALRVAAWHALDEASQMSDLYAVEPKARTASGAATRARELIDLTRRVLLAQAALARHRETGGHAPVDTTEDAARESLGQAVASALDGVASRTETGAEGAHADLRTPLAALRVVGHQVGRGASTWLEGEFALCETLADRVEALQHAAGTR